MFSKQDAEIASLKASNKQLQDQLDEQRTMILEMRAQMNAKK